MESIKKYIEKAQAFSNFYKDNIYKSLEPISDDVIKIFKQCFAQFSKDYELIISNSVYSKIDLYDFIVRVKSPGSLEEKLVRKNLIFKLADDFNLDMLDETKKSLLKKYFYNIDDIIGIKILTSLNYDCANVLKLLKEKESSFHDISFNFNDDIPDLMHNGRKIFKIKCKYKELYCFELQIKSKIDSAWGDIDHNIFYKDYDFNYVKNNNKEIMNNIGNLLEKVEELMLSVRNSKKEFTDSYQKLNFKHNITDKYNEYIESNFKSKFVLEENMNKLYDLYNYSVGTYKVDSVLVEETIKEPNFSDLKSNIYNNYKNLKRNNFEIPLLEIIYFNWMNINEKSLKNEKIIEMLITGLLKLQIIEVKEDLNIELMEDEIIGDILTIITNNIIDFEKANLLIDFFSLAEYILMHAFIDSVKTTISENEYSDFEELDEENIDEFISKINFILFKCIYSSDSKAKLDKDSRIFISMLKQSIENSKKVNNNKKDNKKYQTVIKNSIIMLNLMLEV